MGFTKNINPTIFKTDYRLIIGEDSEAYKRGQMYYKITLLVYHLRLLEIMRNIWSRLKKCGIKFIPLESSVVISVDDLVPTNNPLCEECLKKDKITPATEVHHIIDIADKPSIENALDYKNLLSLCKACHSSITGKKPKKEWKPFRLNGFLLK